MLKRLGIITAALMCLALFNAPVASATQTVDWTGNGLDSVSICVKHGPKPYIHWVLTPGGTPVEGTTADLYINGKNHGQMAPNGDSGALQYTQSIGRRYTYEKLAAADVYAVITSGSVGDTAVLTISDACVCDYM